MTVVGPFGLSVRDQALDTDVRTGLADVEEGLLEATKSDVPFITGAAQHLLAGGRQALPAAAGAAGRAVRRPARPGVVVPSAVVVELTHLATLYHDDVMDEADGAARRCRPPTPAGTTRWPSSPATSCSPAPPTSWPTWDPRRSASRPRRSNGWSPGRSWRPPAPSPGRDPIDHYLDVIAGKTGSLIAVSGRFGALMAGAEEPVVDILTQYGERIGTAFQLADDVLDIASDGHESGKTPGTDLREGIPTLPVLHLRSSRFTSPEDRYLAELLDTDLTDDLRHAEALRLMRAHPALEQARRDTVSYADEARAVLGPLPECPAKKALEGLCDAVVHRAG